MSEADTRLCGLRALPPSPLQRCCWAASTGMITQTGPVSFVQVRLPGADDNGALATTVLPAVTEFTSELMQRAGILSTAQLSNNMVPREFSSDTPIPLEGGWRWGEEVYFRGVLNYTDGFCYENTEQCGCGPQRKAAGPLVEEQQDKLDNALTGIAIVAIVASIVFLVVCVAIAYKCCCKRDEGKTAPESNHMHEATGKESEGKD